jgi:membrane-bound ClpP family serine protease
MTELTNEQPILLPRKFAAMLLLIAGAFLSAPCYANGPGWLGAAGVVLLALGVVRLILKDVRRNETGS